jgi:hypothetical protein
VLDFELVASVARDGGFGDVITDEILGAGVL